MFPFDVILFDIGGVLLTNGWDRRERGVVLDRFGVDREVFEGRHRESYRAWERGVIPLGTYLDSTVFYEPRTFTHDEFFQAICAGSQLLPDGALGILQELAASDRCMLGAMNNEARETNAYRFQQFELNRYFQVALSSCFLHLRKPDLAMFHRSLDILCRPAERVLLIDDREENTLAAVEAGMKAIRFESAEGLRRDLESLGVL